MLAKHTTVESANLFRHKRCICQNVLTTTTKKMKNHEIYLCEIRDPRFEKFRDYSIYLFLDRFLRARDKTCMHLDAFVLLFLEPFSSSNSVSKYSTVAFDFVQFPVWIPINVLTTNLLK